ncbi:MAG: beta-ketoacyl-[acyl-carrier-protein] synthase family protein [Rubrivivax sp.]|nr:beta-ketoacyl-[acyl-carrier-protein] synthase family protein [Rubrivivax sp.]
MKREAEARRVAITGAGIVCCLGRELAEVTRRLREGASGVRAVPHWQRLGVRSLVAGEVAGAEEQREWRRTAAMPKELLLGMSEAAFHCALAAQDALRDAGLAAAELAGARAACIVGNASFGMASSAFEYAKLAAAGQARRIPPFTVLQCMSSSASAAVTNLLQLTGPSYSIAAACATSAHNIGHAMRLVRSGAVDIALAGGGEEVDGFVAAAFEGMRTALSTHYNATPERASRPFDAARDGLVLAGGAGIVVLEAMDRALARGARVHAELAGYGASSDGHSLVAPRPDGVQAAACMREAIADAGLAPGDIDYVNAHATSTPAGDAAEAAALRQVFGARAPAVSSTKSMTGHSLAAAGAHELIYCLAMLGDGFIAPSINIEQLDAGFADLPIVRQAQPARLRAVLSNNFGFGGSNAALVLRAV